ncbi:glycoside hydrolase family 127 protein [Nonomuraea phyllanthi]|uniref:glycoside hydrolase family 127 protein n=1 Tax=Nonomuraea phyllanthi TaxID=2219224 RepID=UPI001292FDD9|nr:beta-L-arabinofuranosidase domain-containing protein [Nonomuraea phyllanthi]QFY07740.1 glycoside hydrolase family 127 protein [Nonomuraea phyllanthi]
MRAPALSSSGIAVHRPLTARLRPHGVLGAWQERNAEATIPHCVARLEDSGVIDNFRRLVGESGAPHRGFVFADSDLYKVIEAVAWEIGRSGTRRWDGWLDEVIGLVARVQDPTGYVMTWIQGVHPEKRFAELEWTHEMYVLGHMVQAAVALDRASGRDDLLAIARRFVDLLHRRFGPGREEGICGHPEIETALVELHRHTGEERHLALARRMIDLRGHGLLKTGHLGARYFQDHLPVREARTAVGHAVRQLYLNAGVTDLYLETGESELLEAQRAQWDNAHLRKMYITGAYGSRHRDEAFGDDYELPSDRAYAETCASIADLQWSWRMLLATGGSRYADVMEREIHNAIAASTDETGTRFFYSNPLQLRPDRYDEENAPRERAPWYACACCPPNIARLVAQLDTYVATADAHDVSVHIYADADIDLPPHLGDGVLEIRTGYPAGGTVDVAVRGRIEPGVRVALRVPEWSRGTVPADEDGYLRIDPGPGFRLDLDVSPRWTRAHPRVDALRGCVALERGPVVYCVEQADLPEDVAVDDLVIDLSVPPKADGATLHLTAHVTEQVTEQAADQATGQEPALYRPAGPAAPAGTSSTLAVPAIPFATWGNRAPGAMRVWMPATTP